MSLGWLTEQTIRPKPATKIIVHNESSRIGLESLIRSKKSEISSVKPPTVVRGRQPKQNRGV